MRPFLETISTTVTTRETREKRVFALNMIVSFFELMLHTGVFKTLRFVRANNDVGVSTVHILQDFVAELRFNRQDTGADIPEG